MTPRHVGVVMDGNRRWARQAGLGSASEGHRRGADHLGDLLGWCQARGIHHLTVYVLSADNIRKRASTEIDFLFELVGDVLTSARTPPRLTTGLTTVAPCPRS
jgi:short-chain Z-isoprenyl diphosphate synthase